MAQHTGAAARGQRLRDRRNSGWERLWSYREYLVKLVYAAVLAGAAEDLLEDRVPLAGIPAEAWALALALLSLLLPRIGMWAFAALLIMTMGRDSFAMGLLLAAGAGLLFWFEDKKEYVVPVRFALLMAAPWTAVYGLAPMSVAAAAAVFASRSWKDGLAQALVMGALAASTGMALPWVSLTPHTASLISLGQPVSAPDFWDHLDSIWVKAFQPWAGGVISDPVPYLRLMGLWTFAAFVGGTAVEAWRRPILRIPALCVAPLLAMVGLAIFRGAPPDLEDGLIALAAALVAWCVAQMVATEPERVYLAPSPRPLRSFVAVPGPVANGPAAPGGPASAPPPSPRAFAGRRAAAPASGGPPPVSVPPAGRGAAPRAKLTWDDVVGLEEAKRLLREGIMLPIENPELVARYGVRPSRGVLIHGPHGTGKTLLGRVLADQLNATFLRADGLDLTGPGGPEGIRRLFARARQALPAVIFIDEIEAVGKRGQSSLAHSALHQLLVEMDGIAPEERLIVVAATSRPQDLDEALMRAGHFDARVPVTLPDLRTRVALLNRGLRGKPGAELVDVQLLARLADGRSAREISEAVNAAARHAALRAAEAGSSSGAVPGLTTESIAAELKLLPR